MNSAQNSYIAIVDDDPAICNSFARLLRTAGFQSVTFPSAEAFLEDGNRPRFDCLVLDFQLPGMSGLELRRRLAAVNDTTPVIFITARDEPDEHTAAEALGCVGFFRKTDPGADILNAIRGVSQAAANSGSNISSPLSDSSYPHSQLLSNKPKETPKP